MNTQMKLYHGSPNKFTDFRIPKDTDDIHGKVMGYGIYLTDDAERASSYAEDGYVYEVDTTPAIKNSRVVNADRVTLDAEEVARIVGGIASEQIESEGYPYILSDWQEPTSETEMDEGNCAIARDIAQNIIASSNDDLDVINDLSNQCGGNDVAAEVLNPVLKKMNIHYAVRDFIETDSNTTSREYIFFEPSDLAITDVRAVKKFTSVDLQKYVEDNANLMTRFSVSQIEQLDRQLASDQRQHVYSKNEIQAAGFALSSSEAIAWVDQAEGQSPVFTISNFSHYELHGKKQDLRLIAKKRMEPEPFRGNLAPILAEATTKAPLHTDYSKAQRAVIQQASVYVATQVLSDGKDKHKLSLDKGMLPLSKQEEHTLKKAIADYSQDLIKFVQKERQKQISHAVEQPRTKAKSHIR